MPRDGFVTETCHHRAVLQHIVLFTFRDEVSAAERAAILEALRGLRTAVPSLRSLAVGENISPARAQGYTHVLVETFDDRAGLGSYADHPAHLPVLARVRAAAAQLLAVDLEAPAP
jgi:Stress responsive A/B Barrel Domain